jgi:hypothetical protein
MSHDVIFGQDRSKAGHWGQTPASNRQQRSEHPVEQNQRKQAASTWSLQRDQRARAMGVHTKPAIYWQPPERDVLRTASSPHRVLDCPTPDQPYQSAMTDHQFQLLLRHLVMIATLGVMAGVLLALALTYL